MQEWRYKTMMSIRQRKIEKAHKKTQGRQKREMEQSRLT